MNSYFWFIASQSPAMILNFVHFSTDWVEEALKSNDILEHISAVSYQSASYYTEMKKQRAGFLIKEILDRFTNKTMSLLIPDRSLWIYAIHSTGMVNLLNSLNLFEEVISTLGAVKTRLIDVL